MSHQDEIFKVKEILYANRDESLLSFEIRDALDNLLTEEKVDTILKHLYDKKLVLLNFPLSSDGDKLPIPVYRLSSEGILDIEKEIQKNDSTLASTTSKIKSPSFNKEQVPVIYQILKNYFDSNQQADLEKIFKGEKISAKLVFNDNGNKLADAFKKLFEKNIITGCNKVHLQKWIENNFVYIIEGKQINFKASYLNKMISGNETLCKNPILSIRLENDQFVIFPVDNTFKSL